MQFKGVFDLEIKVEGWRGRSMEIGSIDSAAWDEGGNAINACVELFKPFEVEHFN